MLKNEIGERLKKIRNAHKDSLRDLAKKIDVSFSALHKIEKGENYPSVEVLEKLSRQYHVQKSYFFGEHQDVPDEFKDQVDWIAFGEDMEKYNLSPDKLKDMLRGFLEELDNKK